MIFRRFVLATIAATALAAAAMAQTSTAGTTMTRASAFPAVGLASSETLQINVVNQATAPSGGTAASCTGSISFYSTTGTLIGTATSFTVTSGQIFSASLPYSKAGTSGTRTVVRATVTLTETAGSGVPCDLASSLETFDTTTGVTHVLAGYGPGGPGH